MCVALMTVVCLSRFVIFAADEQKIGPVQLLNIRQSGAMGRFSSHARAPL